MTHSLRMRASGCVRASEPVPKAQTHPVETGWHGVILTDELPGSETPTEALQETLIAEMRGRIKEDDSTVPVADGAFSYFTRYREGGQHPSICREPRGGGAGEVLIDGDALAAGKAFFRLV
jgi:Prolyl oligopeptidase, N-terminal beta-propeller domain